MGRRPALARRIDRGYAHPCSLPACRPPHSSPKSHHESPHLSPCRFGRSDRTRTRRSILAALEGSRGARSTRAGEGVHPPLHDRWAVAVRDLRSQARRPRRHPRRISAHRHQRAGNADLRAPAHDGSAGSPVRDPAFGASRQRYARDRRPLQPDRTPGRTPIGRTADRSPRPAVHGLRRPATSRRSKRAAGRGAVAAADRRPEQQHVGRSACRVPRPALRSALHHRRDMAARRPDAGLQGAGGRERRTSVSSGGVARRTFDISDRPRPRRKAILGASSNRRSTRFARARHGERSRSRTSRCR